MRGDHTQAQQPRWREQHPEVFAELKRTYGVLGHSCVLMVLSLSLIGTALTIGFLHPSEWLERTVRLVASFAAVCCGLVALGRLLRALWRTLRAALRTRRRAPQLSTPPSRPPHRALRKAKGRTEARARNRGIRPQPDRGRQKTHR
ncbi:hypothetical protein [Streptomyces sp. MZ04]|uniref:hypothetical protein n=1 Tax=Streptomyces sp. MZ04 TaxID=2559236 RepID=UPI001ADF8716|nr:hypothetical protein [Streptomyces sp. MZ04]